MNKKCIYLFVLFVGFGYQNPIKAQQLLTLQEALRTALENNYAIQVAKNDAAISKNNNTAGGAGMLPVVNGNVSQDNQVIDTRQKFLNGNENNRDGARSNTLNAGVELNWTIFDGLRMFASKSKLDELEKIGELRMKANIENVFLRVTKSYYEVVLNKQQLETAKQSLINSEQRLQLAEDKWKAGKIAKTEMLKAKVDFNSDQAAYLRQENLYKNSKVVLNQLLGRDLNTTFEVNDSLAKYKSFVLDDLMNKATENTALQATKKTQQVSFLTVKEAEAERMPTLQLRSGYNLNRQQSEAGFLQSAQNMGFHYGGVLSMNLFNGFEVNRKINMARIQLKSNEYIYKDSLSKIQQQINQAYNNYVLSTALTKLEMENVKVAEENYDIASEQYKVGVITGIELRDAQLNLNLVKLRLLQAQYEAKLNETELMRLTGELLQLQ